jgi:ribosomal protein L31
MNNPTTLDAYTWLKEQLNDQIIPLRDGDCVIGLDDTITLNRNITTLYDLTCETLPFKFKSTQSLQLFSCKVNNFTNFPKDIREQLLINNCGFKSLDGLENINVEEDIYIWNMDLVSYNEEINSALLKNEIGFDTQKHIHYIWTGKNRIYTEYEQMLKIQRELKLKQLTNNE